MPRGKDASAGAAQPRLRLIFATHEGAEIGADETREQAVAATRQLAKRQLTWLRGFGEVQTIGDDPARLAQSFL